MIKWNNFLPIGIPIFVLTEFSGKAPLISLEELETPKRLAATLALKRLDCKG